MNRSRTLALVVSMSMLLPMAAGAMSPAFPDVPEGSLFKTQIEALVKLGVIHGSPDGKFHPKDETNRAAILKMAYLAANRKPKAVTENCFSDLEKYSWYWDFVCDAASPENNFVQGVGNGRFEPNRSVTRAEGLKIILEVMGMKPAIVTNADKDLVRLADIVNSSWYFAYMVTAYKAGMLPITGFDDGGEFYPNVPLVREEAAALIYAGLQAKDRVIAQQEEQQTQASAASTATAASAARASSSKAAEEATMKNLPFPLKDAGTFTKKKSISYLFDINADTVISVNAVATGAIPSQITCRLYLLKDDFSDQYHLGLSDAGSCKILAAVQPGKYQLQIQPTLDNASFTVEAKAGTGDGNDGFQEATPIYRDKSQVGMLEPNDLADWFTFTIPTDREAIVELSAPEKLRCTIYTPPDVDQFGFTGPECDKPYTYAAGTYTLTVARTQGQLAKKVTYVIKWK